MLAGVVAALVDDLAEVHAVVQQLVDRLLAESAARLGADAFGRVVSHHVGGRAIAGEVREDPPHHGCLSLVDDKQTALHVVAQRQRPAHPHALGLTGGDLVADALAGDLTLELGEGQQHVQHQPPHRGGGVDLLGHGAEAHAAAVEHFHHAREVGERAAEPVDLVDHHDVDAAGVDVGQQALERGPLHVATGEATVVVVIRHRNPALVRLALDEGVTGLLLRVDRVEGLVEAFIAGDPAVDRATFGRGQDGSVHRLPPLPAVSPKNFGPDHCVPVMCRAVADRLLKRWPFSS